MVGLERVVIEALEPDAGLHLEAGGLTSDQALPLVHGHGASRFRQPSSNAQADGAGADDGDTAGSDRRSGTVADRVGNGLAHRLHRISLPAGGRHPAAGWRPAGFAIIARSGVSRQTLGVPQCAVWLRCVSHGRAETRRPFRSNPRNTLRPRRRQASWAAARTSGGASGRLDRRSCPRRWLPPPRSSCV